MFWYVSTLWNVLTLCALNFSIFVVFHNEGKIVSGWLTQWEAILHGIGVREEDSVEWKTGSLDWVFVHFYQINNINYIKSLTKYKLNLALSLINTKSF